MTLPSHAVEVDGDPARLAQVVSNLLNNSAKYSEEASRIELTVEVIADRAVLRVRDSGIGIAPAMLPRIFDLFTQGETSIVRCHEGLGIGLALVRNLVELHGGSVQASRRGLGQGTELVVRLPLLRRMPEGESAAIVGPAMFRRGEFSSSTTTAMQPTAWRRCSDSLGMR